MHTILVAEDEPEVRNYLGLALSCQGYNVEFAQNGEEVMSYLSNPGQSDISLLLLDIVMPCKDGLKKHSATSPPPLSGHAGDHALRRALAREYRCRDEERRSRFHFQAGQP